MQSRRGRLIVRGVLSGVGVALVAALLVGCSPPTLGYGAVARSAGGGLTVIIVACEGTITDVSLDRYREDSEGTTGPDDKLEWKGKIVAPARIVLSLGGDPQWLAPEASYWLDGAGETDDPFFPFGNLWGEGPIAVESLIHLQPGQVLKWNSNVRDYLPVPEDEFGWEKCPSFDRPTP